MVSLHPAIQDWEWHLKKCSTCYQASSDASKNGVWDAQVWVAKACTSGKKLHDELPVSSLGG